MAAEGTEGCTVLGRALLSAKGWEEWDGLYLGASVFCHWLTANEWYRPIVTEHAMICGGLYL